MTYSDFQPELERIDIAFYRVLTEGDLHSQPFTFPIPTVNITEDFDWDSKAANAIFENAAKMGSSYFQNFIGSQYIINENGERVPNEKAYKPGAIRSMCCRLQLDLRELLKRGGGLFGSAEMTGSIAVVTINLARLGYLFKGDSEGLYKRLDYLMDLAKSTLIKKRAIIQELFDRGLFPYTKRYLPGFNNHFSTIGINGANEMIRNFTNDKESIVTEFGQKFAYDLLEHMRARIRSYQEETGKLFNLEFSPAEGATYRFAKEDLKRYPDILQAGFGENIYYTNSIQIPANYTDDIFEALELNDDLQILATGGTVLHGYLQENLKSGNDAKNLVRKVITNFKLPYFTLTPVFSICPKHGYISGDHEFCPKCDAELLEQQNRSCGNDC